jgi:hypothetical protein
MTRAPISFLALELIRNLRRPERIRTFQDFFKWLGEVFKTGRGLVPEIPDQFKSQKKK